MNNIIDDYIQAYRIQCLFKAVLKLAADDAYHYKKLSKRLKKRQLDALQFFLNPDDLKVICYLAGVEYTKILSVAQNKNLKIYKKYNRIIGIILEKY